MASERDRRRHGGRGFGWLGLVSSLMLSLSAAAAAAQAAPTETVDQALCRLIDQAARDNGLPADFLTRLIWRESSFRTQVVSPAGAEGVAQFMPGTATERGLSDPFDPQQAIPHAARLIADLDARFGNLGLAAAAYNAGPARVEAWLAGRGGLPAETRAYVAAVTSRGADEWAARRTGAQDGQAAVGAAPAAPQRCLTVVASIRRGPAPPLAAASAPHAGPFAPWGVQLAGNFSKPVALAGYRRVVARHPAILAGAEPMVIGTRLRFRGSQPFWRVRVPAQTRAAAQSLCARLQKAGGACVVLKS